MSTSHKERLEAVVLGCFGSALFWVVLTVGVGVMAWYSNSAYVHGIPAYKAIPIGAGVFLAFALALYLLNLIIRNRKPKSADTDVEKRVEALNAKHQSEVRRYESGYDDLKRKHDTLKNQLGDWEKYAWLTTIATVHANDIDDYVVVEKLYFCYHKLNESIPRIVFGVDIFNKSVFDIAIEDAIQGRIEIAGEPLLRDKRLTHNPTKILPISEGKLTIEQRLSPEEATLIAKCDEGAFGSLFYFDKLVVMIGSGTQFPRFERTQLKLPKFLGSKDTPAATEIATLKAQLEKYKWLHDIAENQRKTIERWVSVVDCGFERYELFRDDPYINFIFYVHNDSVYNVCLESDSLGGAIFFGRRWLSGQLKWCEKPAQMPFGQRRVFIIRQALSQEDKVYILNADSNTKFDFQKLEVTVKGDADFTDMIVPKQLNAYPQGLTNEELLKKYPKLTIEIRQPVFRDYWNFSDPKNIASQGIIINMFIVLTNVRSTQVDVRKFQIRVKVNGKDFSRYAEAGEIYEHKAIGYDREVTLQGQRFTNLNPSGDQIITLEDDQPREGWLQFIVPDGVLNMLAEGTAGEAPATIPAILTITDLSGEKHPAECLLCYEKFSRD